MSTVKLHYSASSNISFHGETDTGVPWCEWREMDESTQAEVVGECLYQLVEINTEEDPGTPCDCGECDQEETDTNVVGDQGA